MADDDWWDNAKEKRVFEPVDAERMDEQIRADVKHGAEIDALRAWVEAQPHIVARAEAVAQANLDLDEAEERLDQAQKWHDASVAKGLRRLNGLRGEVATKRTTALLATHRLDKARRLVKEKYLASAEAAIERAESGGAAGGAMSLPVHPPATRPDQAV